MGAPAIAVHGLRKLYQVHEREAGLLASVRSLVRRRTRAVAAVDGISFEVAEGEIVGFLGPNGAGKTTTLKMLAGLLYPTEGDLAVLGHVPPRRERAFLRQITLRICPVSRRTAPRGPGRCRNGDRGPSARRGPGRRSP